MATVRLLVCLMFLSSFVRSEMPHALERLMKKLDQERVSATVQEAAARGVLSRLLPSHAAAFDLKIVSKIKCGGYACFIISNNDSSIHKGTARVVIEGSTAVEISAGLHWYLKYWCGAHISWDKTGGVQLASVPQPWSLPSVQRGGIRVQRATSWNYYQNVVTSSYSYVWWDWERWEKEIDWMALQGVNLPLAFTGQESIWQKVFQRYNLSKSNLDGFFGGPSFLAWARMGNLHGWGGPLPHSWLQQQLFLQKRILFRMRELGMTPVLPAFSGNVPAGLRTIFPSAKITQLGDWNTVDHDPRWCCTLLLDPTDKLFVEIGQAFVQQQLKDYGGTSHIYNCDTFNENTPPSDDPDYISTLGAAVFDAMHAGDKDAVWLMQVIQRREQDPDTLYSTVEKIVLQSWNKMTTPLHLLAYALSPRYYSSEILDIPGRVPPYRDPEVAAGYKRALNRLFSDPDVASNVRREFVDFVSGKFAEPDAINDQSRLDAIGWWYLHGERYMYLQPLAIKILSQGWLFSSDAAFWKPPQIKALLHSVPFGRMVVLDLFAEVKPIWHRSDQFYGTPYVWCMLHNFGGNIEMYGVLDAIASGPVDARTSQNSTMVGVGMCMEGIEQNPVVYELMSEMAFRSEKVYVEEWLKSYSSRRYGKVVPKLEQAWNILHQTIYNCTDGIEDHNKDFIVDFPDINPSLSSEFATTKGNKMINFEKTLGAERHLLMESHPAWLQQPHLWYLPSKVIEALHLFLESGEALTHSITYRYDLVDLTRQALAKLANQIFRNAVIAYNLENIQEAALQSQKFLGIITDLDILLASDDNFLLGTWLESAKRLAVNPRQVKQYEWNARTQVTMWFDNTKLNQSKLHDYANKYWSGLLKNYCLPRASIYFDYLLESMKENKSFPLDMWRKDWIKFSNKWQEDTDLYSVKAEGNALKISQALFEKYFKG